MTVYIVSLRGVGKNEGTDVPFCGAFDTLEKAQARGEEYNAMFHGGPVEWLVPESRCDSYTDGMSPGFELMIRHTTVE